MNSVIGRSWKKPPKNNSFPNPSSQRSRLLKLRELPARFFEGLSNPSGVAVERFSGFRAVHHRASALRRPQGRFYG
jgi:hypothetical protein